jgi:pimeloyl-ACP methyl ester carboxylesterase
MESIRRIVRANAVELCVETSGDRVDPPILLIHGAAASMLGWPEEFRDRLVAGGRFVIRYDHRDTGESVSYPPGQPGYGFLDLVDDSLAILDELGIKHAHVVGASMGGGIAQSLGRRFPDRVETLTLIATSPGDPDLPPPSSDAMTKLSTRAEPDWTDRTAVVDYVMETFRIFAGGTGRFAGETFREIVERDLDRMTTNVASSQINHFVMDINGSTEEAGAEITAPALIIHGLDDPMFPIEHARALKAQIPNARLIELEDVGHLVLGQAMSEVANAILIHTDGGVQ